MFGLFYPVKVCNELKRMGWTNEMLPNPLDTIWGGLLRTMKSKNVPAESAAKVLDRALQGDPDCIDYVKEKSGAYGIMFFGAQRQ